MSRAIAVAGVFVVVMLTARDAWAPPKGKKGAAERADAGPPISAPLPADTPRIDDQVTRALERALTMHRLGDGPNALRAIYDALDEERARSPLEVHNGAVLAEPPENLGMYRPAPGSMVFGDSVLLYAEVENHGFRKRPEGLEVDLWTDVLLLYEDGERIGGKEHFGEHRFIASVPHRTTHLVMEVATGKLPAQPYLAEIVVHDAVSGKVGKVRIPFRVAARPGHP